MPTLTETRTQGGNLVMAEWDLRVSREACTIRNTEAAAYADQQLFGLPVANVTRINDNVYRADLLLAGDEATAEGVILANDVVDFAATGGGGAETTKRYPVIVRGPVMINKNQIRATDPAGAAYNRDTLAATLSALGIVTRAEPAQALT